MSLMTKRQATKGSGKAGLAARKAARRGAHHARTWAAPRLERTGQALEQRVAPRVAAMMSAAARRIEPAPRKRRRWPLVAAGFVAAAGVSATAAYLMSRRGSSVAPVFASEEPTVAPVPQPQTERETAGSGVNGRVRTP